MKYVETCPHCNTKFVAYTYKLNKSRVASLRALVDYYEAHRGPVKIKDLGLTNAQYVTFAHLKYWKFVERIPYGYIPTRYGIDFVYGYEKAWETVAVINSKLLGLDHEAWRTHKEKNKLKLVFDINRTAFKEHEQFQAEKGQKDPVLF